MVGLIRTSSAGVGPARALAALAVLVSLVGAPRAQDTASLGSEVARALEETSGEVLVEEITALGSAVVPVVFDAAATGELLVTGERGEPLTLTVPQHDRIRLEHVLVRLEPRHVLRHLRDVATGPLEEPARELAVRLLEPLGEREDLALVAELTVEPDGGRVPRARRQAFQRSFGAIYERHGAVPNALGRLYREAPLDLAAPMIWSIGAANTNEALEHLSLLLGLVDEADPLILAELTRLGAKLPHPLPDVAPASVRSYLNSLDVERLLIAIRAVQALEDTAATERLIDLCGHPTDAIAGAAAGALRELSGIDRGRGQARWAEWFEKTSTWWRWKAPELLDDLANGDSARASSALLELSKWRLYRHEIAPEVARVLAHDDRELRALACAVLGHLGSWEGVPALIDTLDADDPDVVLAAAMALRRITGHDHGTDRAAWGALWSTSN